MGLSRNEFNDRNIKSVDRLCKVLKYLNEGRELKINDLPEVKLAETEGEGFILVGKWSVTSSDNLRETREEWMGIDLSINQLAKEVLKMDQKEFDLMDMNMALQSIKREEAKKR